MLTRIPRGPSSVLATRDRPRTPHLLTPVGSRVVAGEHPRSSMTFTIEPPWSSARVADWMPRSVPVRLNGEHAVPVGEARSRRVVRETKMPALLTSPSRAAVLRLRPVDKPLAPVLRHARRRACGSLPQPVAPTGSSCRSVAITTAPSAARAAASASLLTARRAGDDDDLAFHASILRIESAAVGRLASSFRSETIRQQSYSHRHLFRGPCARRVI